MSSSSLFGSIPSTSTILFGEVDSEGAHQPNLVNQLLLVIVATVIFIIIYKIVKTIIQQVRSDQDATPYLVPNTKDAQTSLRIEQNPLKDNNGTVIELRRSRNEEEGLEFTYSWWTYIRDFEYKKGEWKNVFFKGNSTSWPLRAPGVWLHPTENSMHFYMNSYGDIQNEVAVSNIPVGKWFHTSLVVEQDHMSIYINGYLKERKRLAGIARQNFGDVYINAFGGFSGFLSRMRYYDYAVALSDVQADVQIGPNLKLPYSEQQQPPYLAPYWWVNNYNG
jgi:hypothetical protein